MYAKRQKQKAIGQRGKESEKAVRKILDEINTERADFDFSRIYDARSAGGKFPARPGDFEVYYNGIFGLIEVKEVAHDYRLPRANFEDTPRANLRKRQMAGGRILVLVNFTTVRQWRTAPLEYFVAGVPSWDMRDTPFCDPETQIRAMLSIGPGANRNRKC